MFTSTFNSSQLYQHSREGGNLMPTCSNPPASFYVLGAEAASMKLNGMNYNEANRVTIKHEVLDESLVDQNHSPTSVFAGSGSGTSDGRISEYELMKQSGSHAGLFDNTMFDIGIPIIRDVDSNRAGNGKNRNPGMSAFNSEITASLAGLKRMKTDEGNAFPISNKFQYQNESFGYPVHGLVHHLSLPRSSVQMAATMETFPLLQHSVPVRIRAKRGCATHPRSIAERMRRMRISERIRRLQELFPNMDKANIADMLDVAAEYIKELQNQIKTLSTTQATCTCSAAPVMKINDHYETRR